MICAMGKFQGSGAGASECQDCDAGKYLYGTTAAEFDNSNDCKSCEKGFYSSEPGSSVCEPCIPGRFSMSGATKCTICEVGKSQSETNASFCTSCPVGYFQSTEEATNCVACPAGQFTGLEVSSACTACTAGRFQDAGGQSRCIVCAAGYFANTSHMTSCYACAHGQIARAENAHQCTECDSGRYQASSAQTSCISCPAGFFTDSSTLKKDKCNECPSGWHASSSQSAECQKCSVGKYASDVNSTDCSVCPKGYIAANLNSTSCGFCGGRTYQISAGGKECTDCPEGHSHTPSSCAVCGAGYFDDGSLLSVNSTICKACPSGQYSQRKSKECSQCNFVDGQGKPEGYEPDRDQKSCVKCTTGMYRNFNDDSDTGMCKACVNRTIAPQQGQSHCSACPDTHFFTGAKNPCQYKDRAWYSITILYTLVPLRTSPTYETIEELQRALEFTLNDIILQDSALPTDEQAPTAYYRPFFMVNRGKQAIEYFQADMTFELNSPETIAAIRTLDIFKYAKFVSASFKSRYVQGPLMQAPRF